MSPVAKRASVSESRSARLAVEVGFRSDKGERAANEDYAAAVLPSPASPILIAALADGVGGAKGGRVAAELSVRSFIDACRGCEPTAALKETATRSLLAINLWMHGIGQVDPDLAGMASTFTALVLVGREAQIFHVGDSRIYRLRGGRIERLSHDHASGPIDSRRLERAVGAEDALRIDHLATGVELHDRYLLCSDGIHGGLSDKAILRALERRAAPAETASALVEEALAARIGDNATALIVDVVELPPPDAASLGAALPEAISQPPRLGETVDGFRLDDMLGDSRYVTVFRATDLEDAGARVVLKFPKPLEGADAPMREAFLREMWVASLVRSPFVGETLRLAAGRRTRLYLAMPFYEGETLEGRLKRSPVSLQAGIAIARGLARGVAALHRAGVIHRDIKPDNVLLTPAERGAAQGLKLIDLGVARLKRSRDVVLASEPGTPSYMAPELFDGCSADEASDLYAVGVTVYRMFCGRYPYGEIEPFTHPRFREPTPLSTHRPDLPAWLDRTVARAIAVDPNDRYGDVLEFMFELEHGADRASPVLMRRRSLYERNPILFWQCVSLVLAAALLWCLHAIVLR